MAMSEWLMQMLRVLLYKRFCQFVPVVGKIEPCLFLGLISSALRDRPPPSRHLKAFP
jgi:hypothetical protein